MALSVTWFMAFLLSCSFCFPLWNIPCLHVWFYQWDVDLHALCLHRHRECKKCVFSRRSEVRLCSTFSLSFAARGCTGKAITLSVCLCVCACMCVWVGGRGETDGQLCHGICWTESMTVDECAERILGGCVFVTNEHVWGKGKYRAAVTDWAVGVCALPCTDLVAEGLDVSSACLSV